MRVPVISARRFVTDTLGTLSTGQIYDADVTALPKKTGNENVVGQVTSKH